jgi:hypothetical protein
MNAMDLLPDVLLAAAITVIGIRVVLDRNLRGATGWFILFCVVLSLCWMRLQLFWLGVAEAFIGAFLTGWIVRSAPLPRSWRCRTPTICPRMPMMCPLDPCSDIHIW